MSQFYQKSQDEVLDSLGVTKEGLRTADVIARRGQYGPNQLEEGRRKTTLEVVFDQFKDFLVLILIAAAAISAFLGKLESAVFILLVVCLNAVIGAMQHLKAEQSLNSLRALSSPTAKVLRDGQKTEIPSQEIVVGDILYLDAGDFVSADGRILENHSLQINESSLTGESVSVLKMSEAIDKDKLSLGDKRNMVFSGSFVTYGRGVVVVTATGMKTEIGKIAHLLGTSKEQQTPLQASLDQFGSRLALAIIVIAVAILALDVARGRPLVESFLFAVALAVAAIPEALSSIVTIVLAVGTQKMARENAIVRRLHAVESLGSISVICSDKTGTLTQNKMTVQHTYVDNRVIAHDNLKMTDSIEKRLLLIALLSNDSVTIDQKEIGDPTEVALVNLGDVYGLDELVLRQEYPRLGELPFDSERKMMSTVNSVEGRTMLHTKGALDVILARVVQVETAQGIVPFTAEHRGEIERVNGEFSANGLRVLGFAYKELATGNPVELSDENDLIFVGLMAMMDPPRLESAPAVKECLAAGIKPVMITGDHKITATAIARQVGILQDESEAIEGSEIENWSDEVLRANVARISVYARVSPEHKIRIVKAWQDIGNVVAMTGDGVNDAPALKQADVGIAMGITGTEVAKDSASIILTDDNFSTIVKAISNGRSIYANIQNSIRFLLAGNAGGVLSVLYASLFALAAPFTAMHLLFINLLTDSLPAIAIGLEPHNKKVMSERPRDINTPLLSQAFARRVLTEGVLIATVTMTAFHIGLRTGDTAIAGTMAFATLCLARLLHGFNARSTQSIFRIGLFTNQYSWYALLLGLALLHIVLLVPPLMRVFAIATLSAAQLGTIYGLAAIPLVLIQIYRLLPAKN